MKKILLVFILISSVFSLFAKGKADKNVDSSNSVEVKTEKVEITGIVSMYGNMPFSFPGIETEDGKRYTIVSEDKKLIKKIKETSGKKVNLTGIINLPLSDDEKVFQMLKDGFIYVESFEKIKPKKIGE